MPRNVTGLSVVLVLLCIAGLSACGGDDSKSTAPQGDVDAQLGFDDAGILARQSRVENTIRTCMSAEGFEYVPVDPVAQRTALTGAHRLAEEDFIKQFGFGVSTFWGRGGAQADPNLRARAGLGPADRVQYDRTLWGENTGASFADAVDNGDFTKLGGCTGKATAAVFGGAQVLTQLQGKIDELDERIVEDPRMVRAGEKWAVCVSAAGHPYDDPEVIESDLTRRMESIVGPVPGKFTTGPAAGETSQPIDRAALSALQREEISIARADFDCEQKHIAPVEAVVRPVYEARFREQNQPLLGQVKPLR